MAADTAEHDTNVLVEVSTYETVTPKRGCRVDGLACANCSDDDGDGFTDAADPHCMGHDDDDEGRFALFSASPVSAAGTVDCWFDNNIGGQDDGCAIPSSCLIEPSGAGCRPSGRCVERCLPLTPPGCDCFGCCTICEGGECATVQVNSAVAPSCTLDALADASACPPCTPRPDCSRACDGTDCTLCPGQSVADLPATCGGVNVCPAGLTRCVTDNDCPDMSTYCHTGCCRAVGIPLERGPVIEDFETNSRFDRWGGIIWSQLDDVGSTMTPAPWLVGSASLPPVSHGSGLAACVEGVLARENGGAGVFPGAALQLVLDRAGAAVNVGGFTTPGGIEFAFYVDMPGSEYRVQIATSNVRDFGYYEYRLRPRVQGWSTWSLYFPGTVRAPVFAQPGWADPVAFDPARVTGVYFGPVASQEDAVAYAFCLDAVTLAVAPPSSDGLISDFELNDYFLENEAGGAINTVVDTIGSSLTPHPWLIGSAVEPPGSGNASLLAGCISGRLAASNNGDAFAQLQVFLEPDASAGDITGYAADPGLRFLYYAPAVGDSMRVFLLRAAPAAAFSRLVRARKAGWQEVVVYAPGVATDRVFEPPAGGSAAGFDPTRVTGFAFAPIATPMKATDFQLCVDDLALKTPPAPAATPNGPPLVTDFEDGLVVTAWPGGPIFVAVDSFGSTVSPQTWNAGSATVPGARGESDYAGCLAGTIAKNDTVADKFPYVQLSLGLAAPAATADITAFSPEHGLSFDFKGLPGVGYTARIVTPNVSDSGYYGVQIVPTDGEWHHFHVYFVGFGQVGDGSDELSQPIWADPAAWRPQTAKRVEFGPISRDETPVRYDFCVDNVRFH